MACVKQWQRRALEKLRPWTIVPLVFSVNGKDEFYLINGKRIYLLGVSSGIGTCSDLKDVNIAVFGYEKPKFIIFPRRWNKTCQWAALLREPTKKELQEKQAEGIYCWMVVEGLEIFKLEKMKDFNRFYFF